MALRWADPFDQYGGSVADMLQGPWAQVDTTLWSLSNTKRAHRAPGRCAWPVPACRRTRSPGGCSATRSPR
jgi:hypothetical protein